MMSENRPAQEDSCANRDPREVLATRADVSSEVLVLEPIPNRSAA